MNLLREYVSELLTEQSETVTFREVEGLAVDLRYAILQ